MMVKKVMIFSMFQLNVIRNFPQRAAYDRTNIIQISKNHQQLQGKLRKNNLLKRNKNYWCRAFKVLQEMITFQARLKMSYCRPISKCQMFTVTSMTIRWPQEEYHLRMARHLQVNLELNQITLLTVTDNKKIKLFHKFRLRLGQRPKCLKQNILPIIKRQTIN